MRSNLKPGENLVDSVTRATFTVVEVHESDGAPTLRAANGHVYHPGAFDTSDLLDPLEEIERLRGLVDRAVRELDTRYDQHDAVDLLNLTTRVRTLLSDG